MESKKMNIIELDFKSLKNNILNISSKRKIAVYLPPSYFSSNKTYPVLYFLTGLGNDIFNFLDGIYQGFNFEEALNRLLEEKKIKDMIVVLFDCNIYTGGAFYNNSIVNGNWEDLFIKELLPYIKDNFRIKKESKNIGISGHSMGGYAAFNFAMKYPQEFSYVYSMSPGMFGENGLKKCFFEKKEKLIYILDKIDRNKKEKNNIIDENFLEKIKFPVSYGMSFSPKKEFPYFNYPFDIINNNLVENKKVLNDWENGYGNFKFKIIDNIENLREIKEIVFEYGNKDYFSWLIDGVNMVSKFLEKNNISNKILKYEGDHTDKIRERIEKKLLVYFSENFYKK